MVIKSAPELGLLELPRDHWEWFVATSGLVHLELGVEWQETKITQALSPELREF